MEQLWPEALQPLEERKQSELRNKLDFVLSAELSPENIDSYATDALNGMVGLAESLRQEYAVDEHNWDNFTENNAFAINNLGHVDDNIDHIINIASSIDNLDKVISSIEKKSEIILPPDTDHDIKRGNGTGVESPVAVQRLKTILFILQKDFGLDLHDEDQISMYKGTNSEAMIRRESYTCVDVAALNKLILVCDEMDNATYIFDIDKVQAKGFSTTQLQDHTKKQLNDKIAMHQDIGQRIVYSKNFVKDIKNALTSKESHKSSSESQGYLIPSAEDYQAILPSVVAKQYGVHENTVQKIIKELDIPQSKYAFNRGIKLGIKRSDTELIRQHPMVAMPKSEDYAAIGIEEIGRLHNRSRSYVEKKIGELGLQTGDFRFGSRSRIGKGLLEADAKQLVASFDPIVSAVEEGTVTGLTNVARMMKVRDVAVRMAAEDLGLELKQYRIDGHNYIGFTDDDIKILRQHPTICIPRADDYQAVSLAELVREYKRGPDTIIKLMDQTGIRTGEYYFGPKLGKGITSDDYQKLIKTMQNIAQPASDNVNSLNVVRERFNVTPNAILTAAERQGIQGKVYKFNARESLGFTKEEVNLIWQDQKIATPSAEEYGAVSFRIARDHLKIGSPKLEQAIGALGIIAGEYRFGPNYTKGILPDDIIRLEEYLQ